MDLSFRAIHDVVHATAAFAETRNGDDDDGRDRGKGDGSVLSGQAADGDDADSNCSSSSSSSSRGGTDGSTVSWTRSQLNPKNRIDSLAPLADPLWRIDGSAGFGTQYYAYPLFLADRRLPPMHIDVFVHEGASYTPTLRAVLDLDQAFHTKDAVRVRRLGVTQHLLRILQRQTTHPDGQLRPDVVEDLFRRGPFGSRIVIEDLSCHIHEAQVVLSPNYLLENDLMSYHELIDMWGLAGQQDRLPPEVSIANVRWVRQLHDSICEVYVDAHSEQHGGVVEDGTGHEPRLVVLKSLSSGIKYMYQEIRALVRDVQPHPHVLSRPLHIITKQCLFGNKRGVIGFTMPHYAAGSLRDALPLLRIHGTLRLADQLRWSCQIAAAMCHVWHEGRGAFYYPDLRLDNVVLTAPAPKGDAGLVDFEQRGVWCSFSSPEVNYIESLRLLAFDDQDFDFAIDEEVCAEYRRKLVDCYEAALAADRASEAAAAAAAAAAGPSSAQPPSKRPLIVRLEEETKYSNPPQGYNVPWICLTRREREAAMVYMLGRMLWCLFEGMSAPHRGAVWQSYPREPDALEFPAFERTPPAVQALILRCFGDSGAVEQSHFVRQGGKLYMKQGVGGGGGGGGGAAPASYELVSDDLTGRARGFWKTRLEEGEVWLQQRNERLRQEAKNGSKDEDPTTSAYGRPTLRQVLTSLQELDGHVGGS